MNKTPQTIKASIVLSVFILSAFISAPLDADAQTMQQVNWVNGTGSSTILMSTSTTPLIAVDAIMWPEIEAKSAFIYNPVGNQIIYEKNADVQRPTASLLKIMTAATADNLLTSAPSLVSKQLSMINMKNEAPIDASLATNSKWLPETLLKVMLLGSSNKAAETLASQLIPRSSFISLMNFHAKRIGLTKTYFRNASGLTEVSKTNKGTQNNTEGQLDIAGGVSTAREVAQMMWAVIAQNPGLLDVTRQEALMIDVIKSTGKSAQKGPETQNTLLLSNTNKILHDFPIIFGKTGFTLNAGGNLAIVMQKSETSEPYVIVVLGSTAEKRFEDVAKLASTTLQIINMQNSITASAILTSTTTAKQ